MPTFQALDPYCICDGVSYYTLFSTDSKMLASKMYQECAVVLRRQRKEYFPDYDGSRGLKISELPDHQNEHLPVHNIASERYLALFDRFLRKVDKVPHKGILM